jgi:hypothetical protein
MAMAKKLLSRGQKYLGVVNYLASFASEQLCSMSTRMCSALQPLRRFSKKLSKHRAHRIEKGTTREIQEWLSERFFYSSI